MKHEETYEELALGRILSHLVTSFQTASYFPIHQICLRSKSVHNSPFIKNFLPHIVSYTKFILMAVGGESKLVIFALSKYLVYLINSKGTCNCLTWIVVYRKLY